MSYRPKTTGRNMDEINRSLYERLMVILSRDPRTIKHICPIVGITYPTMQDFLNNARPMNILTQAKIVAFLNNEEKRLGIV